MDSDDFWAMGCVWIDRMVDVMNTFNTVILPSVIASNSANSAIQARRRQEECKIILDDYKHIDNPTIAEQRQYASCVYTVHGSGEQLSSMDSTFIKVIIILMIGSYLVGLYKYFQDDYWNLAEKILMAVIYPIVAFLMMVLVVLIATGITFIFT